MYLIIHATKPVAIGNWEKLRIRKGGEWKNVVMKDGEKINFREVLSATREKRKLILIIDESHVGKDTERTAELLEEIQAELIIEMSATPSLEATIEDYQKGFWQSAPVNKESEIVVPTVQTKGVHIRIDPQMAIDEGLIKKELIINEKIGKITSDEADSQEVVLETAFQKRVELKKLFAKEEARINPLVLVQIPTAEAGADKISAVKKFLEGKGITEENGKLAIWLAEQKSETLDFVSEPENEIEFLIFKQAIDTGWDCPRTYILVKFREPSKNEAFEIQTVGRILRMPEQKHYASEDLNRGYIYTNVLSVMVKKEEYNPNIIKHLKSARRDFYKPIALTSYFKSRADYGDITASFLPVFEETACGYFGLKERDFSVSKNMKLLKKKGLIFDGKKFRQDIIADTHIEGKSFDQIEGEIESADKISLRLAIEDREGVFYQKIKEHLGTFGNIKRSRPIVKSALYVWFEKYLGSKKWDDPAFIIQNIFLEHYEKHFSKILDSAVGKYKGIREKEVRKRVEESEHWETFEIAEERSFNQHTDSAENYKKYVYEPCYLDDSRLKPERNFEKFLEENDEKILWWWKNGESTQDDFGIKYAYAGEVHTFYPDYLVRFLDGRIGIFETKDKGDQEGTTKTKAKAEALAKYIKEEVKKGKKLFGGIAIEVGNVWQMNNVEKYDWGKCEKGDWGEWRRLEF